jgi:hypothetical protein
MITCKQVSTLVMSAEVERQSVWKRFEIGFHLRMCKYCSRIARQMESIRDASRRLRLSFDSENPPGGPSGLEEKILAKLRNPPADSDGPVK